MQSANAIHARRQGGGRALRHASEFLLGLPERMRNRQPLEDYACALGKTDYLASGILDAGHDSFVLEMEGGRVLKVTCLEILEEFGNRPFDAPIFEKGSIHLDGRGLFVQSVGFMVQPLVEMRATEKDSDAFGNHVRRMGYFFHDNGPHQIGYFEGRLVLVDPFAVVRIRQE